MLKAKAKDMFTTGRAGGFFALKHKKKAGPAATGPALKSVSDDLSVDESSLLILYQRPKEKITVLGAATVQRAADAI